MYKVWKISLVILIIQVISVLISKFTHFTSLDVLILTIDVTIALIFLSAVATLLARPGSMNEIMSLLFYLSVISGAINAITSIVNILITTHCNDNLILSFVSLFIFIVILIYTLKCILKLTKEIDPKQNTLVTILCSLPVVSILFGGIALAILTSSDKVK